MYRIMKVLNNNGILVLDDQSGRELIRLEMEWGLATGSGNG